MRRRFSIVLMKIRTRDGRYHFDDPDDEIPDGKGVCVPLLLCDSRPFSELSDLNAADLTRHLGDATSKSETVSDAMAGHRPDYARLTDEMIAKRSGRKGRLSRRPEHRSAVPSGTGRGVTSAAGRTSCGRPMMRARRIRPVHGLSSNGSNASGRRPRLVRSVSARGGRRGPPQVPGNPLPTL